MTSINEIRSGPYVGQIRADLAGPDLTAQLEQIQDLLAAPEAEVIYTGRNRIVRLPLRIGGEERLVAVKVSGSTGFFRSLGARAFGSSARRTFTHSCGFCDSGLDTPEPIAFLERWHGGRLAEAYYVAAFDERPAFKDELARLYQERPRWQHFERLLDVIAHEIRRLHDAGFQHNDLGNQNILVRPDGDGGWKDVAFIDVGRARSRRKLGMRARAVDVSRLSMPHALLESFMRAYFDGVDAPPAFRFWEGAARLRFALHTRTRSLRHPVRELILRRKPSSEHHYPALRNTWIWNTDEGRPIDVWRPFERFFMHPTRGWWRGLGGLMRHYASMRFAFQRLHRSRFRDEVELDGRIGILVDAASVHGGATDRIVAMGFPVPVLLQRHANDSEADHAALLLARDRLHAAGCPLGLALVQDRERARNADAWEAFVREALGEFGACVEWVEAGCGLNDPSWGVWRTYEAARMVHTVSRVWASARNVGIAAPSIMGAGAVPMLTLSDNIDAGTMHEAAALRLRLPSRAIGVETLLDRLTWLRAAAHCVPQATGRLFVTELRPESLRAEAAAARILLAAAAVVCSGMAERTYLPARVVVGAAHSAAETRDFFAHLAGGRYMKLESFGGGSRYLVRRDPGDTLGLGTRLGPEGGLVWSNANEEGGA